MKDDLDKTHGAFAVMITHGGSFASQLALAWFHADTHNKRRIQGAFPELVERYRELNNHIGDTDE